MKKSLFTLVAVLLCAVIMLGILTSCTDNKAPAYDENNTEIEIPENGKNTENTESTGDKTVAEPFDLSDVEIDKINFYVPSGEQTGHIENNGEMLVPEYVLKVNGVPISVEEFRYYYLTLKRSMDGDDDTLWSADAPEENRLTEEDVKSLENQTLNAIKQVYVYQTLATKYGLTITEEEQTEIDTYVQQVIDTMNVEGSELTYEDALVLDNLTDGLFRYTMSLNFIANKIFDYLYFSENAPLAYNDAKMMEAMNDLGYVRTQQLLVKFPDAPTEGTEEEKAAAVEAGKTEAKAKAEEALAKINAGEDFMTVVGEYNDDPGMDYYGEDGYYFTSGTMVEEYEAASFALEEGAVSDIVETSYGYHIIKRMPLELDYIKTNASEYFYNEYMKDFFAKLEATFDNVTVEYAPEYEFVSPLTVK